jgi:hypothetical protein
MPMQPEYDLDLNIKVIEKFLIFPTVICTPPYNKWFRSNAILKSTRLLNFWAGQI